MSPYPHPMSRRHLHRSIHDHRVAGVPSTCYIGGADTLHQIFVLSQVVCAEALSHIGVKVNSRQSLSSIS